MTVLVHVLSVVWSMWCYSLVGILPKFLILEMGHYLAFAVLEQERITIRLRPFTHAIFDATFVPPFNAILVCRGWARDKKSQVWTGSEISVIFVRVVAADLSPRCRGFEYVGNLVQLGGNWILKNCNKYLTRIPQKSTRLHLWQTL